MYKLRFKAIYAKGLLDMEINEWNMHNKKY